MANPLLKGKILDIDSNPLTSAEVARKWARWAREAGKSELAAKWDVYAIGIGG